MLDHLSNGRLDIGVGRGASPYEIALYGICTQAARDTFEEALEVLKKAMTQPILSHRGEFYRYYDVPLTMRPLQAGGPPMWYGAFTERNLVFAAQHGLNVTLNGPPARLRQLSERYREIWADASPGAAGPRIASMYQMFIGETDAEAERIAESAYAMWYGNMVHLWKANNAMPRDTLPAGLDAAKRIGSFLVGSADTVAERLQGIIDTSGLDRILLQCNMGDMPHQAVLESLGRFAHDVRPRLRSGTAPARDAA